MPPPGTAMRFALIVLLCLLTGAVHAEPPREQWFTALLDGRKIGRMEATREVDGEIVRSMQQLSLTLERAGSQVEMSSRSEATERLDGTPLSFAGSSRLSGNASRIAGTLSGTTLRATLHDGHAESTRELAWPAAALLPEGLRLSGLKAGLAPGTRYTTRAFQDMTLDAVDIVTVVGARETIDLPGGPRDLVRLDQMLDFPGAPLATQAWVDEELTVWKLVMPVFGTDLTLLACDRACAMAPNQGSDVFSRLLMRSPRPLAAGELAGALRYTLKPRNGHAGALALPPTTEQHVRLRGGEVEVVVDRHARPSTEDRPTAADTAATDWLQSTAPDIVALARRGAGDAADAASRMQALETFVRGYITTKNLDVGYASALDVARDPRGDCTEHAVLLAALARALDIPARVVTGLAYAPGFAGSRDAFVPHAWVQAWTGDRWRSYDAALNGFDAGHLALSIGDGDPWRFYAGIGTLGNLLLERIEPVDTR